MTADKSPLSEKAGLSPIILSGPGVSGHFDKAVFLAEDVERLLASAPVVYGCKDIPDVYWSSDRPCDEDTHTARLIMIEPIEQDSERKVLDDLVSIAVDSLISDPGIWKCINRAKALLAKEE